MRLLGGRAHSTAELRQKLLRRGCDADEVDQALRRLAELGYLDDGRYAAALVERRGRSRGPAAIAAELRSKGLDRTQVQAALSGIDGGGQLAAATRLAGRMLETMPPGGPDGVSRVAARLMRRGFGGGVVRQALRQAVAERTAGAGLDSGLDAG